MLKRYSIWDKESPIICPSGIMFTAEEWKQQHPVAKLDNITIVCQAGEINGGFFGTLGGMVQMYEQQGLEFSNAKSDVEKLEMIEAFEDSQQPIDTGESSAEERIASALEFQNLMAMGDVNNIADLEGL